MLNWNKSLEQPNNKKVLGTKKAGKTGFIILLNNILLAIATAVAVAITSLVMVLIRVVNMPVAQLLVRSFTHILNLAGKV